MKRIGLFSILCGLVISLAAPTGAAFGLEGMDVDQNVGLIEVSAEPMGQENATSVVDGSDTKENVDTLVESKEAEEAPEPDSPQLPPVVVPPPVVLPVSPLLITAYKSAGAHMRVVQLYNNSSSMVVLDGVSILYVAGENEYEIPISGWAEPRSYIVLAWQGESEYADAEFAFDNVGQGNVETITLQHAGHQPLMVNVPTGYNGELLHRFKSAAGNYTTNTTFATGEATVFGGGLYRLPGAPDLSVLEILVSPRSCVFGDELTDCFDYIKVRNDGAFPLDLGLYRLRSGYSNASSTATNTAYFSEVLTPGEVRTLAHDSDGKRVSFTANDGSVWMEDRYGYESYDLHVPPYVGSHLAAQSGRSWAYNEASESWQWATPAPDSEENNFTVIEEPGKGAKPPSSLVPCKDNQYRSEETNRCRNIVVASTLTPCREGQYRSEETNRCRSIATAAAAVLKPCADDQFRNPETNRCKKIASSEDVALADCGEGRERNPLTNRCRNVLGVSTLADTMPFPVEKIEEGRERFAGWWTIGIVALTGVLYGTWEWREELRSLGKRALQFVGRGK